MTLYRLCKQAYVHDLTGRGAELNGGRWNGKGRIALYTAGSRALAVLEVAVHIPFGILPTNYWMVTLEITGKPGIKKINIGDLPNNWNTHPPIKTTQYMGDEFLTANSQLILQIPSAVVSGEYNYVVNPTHPDFKLLKVIKTEPFEFDLRLFKK